MTELIPITIMETLSRNRAKPPIAKSQPHAIDNTIKKILRKLRKVKRSNAMISVTAIITESMLSDLICEAFPTAITGPPII